jgi:hypothetical protein
MDVYYYWQSAWVHGGPVLSSALMRRFGELWIELGFNVYG